MKDLNISQKELDHLISETLKILEESHEKIGLDMIDASFRSSLSINEENELVIVSSLKDASILKGKQPSKKKIREYLKKIEDKVKKAICTEEVKKLLDGGDFKDALKILIPLVISALGLTALTPAVLGIVVAVAAYLIKVGIFDMCEWKKEVVLPKFVEGKVVKNISELKELTVASNAKKDKKSSNEEEEQEKEAVALLESINWAGAIFGIPRIWQQTQGEGIRVAVLDTGVDTDHPDLKDAIVETYDFTGQGIEDGNGHGTHCAGIIGARLNNVGFVGVAPKCELLIGKILTNQGAGSWLWLAQGIGWAIKCKAHIISMSLGGARAPNSVFKAVQEALGKGMILVCAAGNDGSLYQNSIGAPGRWGGVITVASHDKNGNPSGFSSRGGEVDVMGPGTDIWSTYKNGGYATLSGTSMATPFVAGLAALILSKHLSAEVNDTPLENNEDMKEHLLWMATHPGHHDNASGYGPLQPLSYFK